MATSPLNSKLQSLTGGSVHLTRIAAVIVALIGSLAVWLISDPIAGANLRATGMGADDPVNIGAGEVLGAFATWGIGALIVVYLLERFSPNARKVWLIVGVVALLISFIPIFASSENTATTITFILMHLVSAAVIIPAFLSTLRLK